MIIPDRMNHDFVEHQSAPLLKCSKCHLIFDYFSVYSYGQYRIYKTNTYLVLTCDEYIIKQIIE
jgi:hypothetical protein